MNFRFHLIGPHCAVNTYLKRADIKKGKIFTYDHWFIYFILDDEIYNISFTRDYVPDKFIPHGIILIRCKCKRFYTYTDNNFPYLFIDLDCNSCEYTTQKLIHDLLNFTCRFKANKSNL